MDTNSQAKTPAGPVPEHPFLVAISKAIEDGAIRIDDCDDDCNDPHGVHSTCESSGRVEAVEGHPDDVAKLVATPALHWLINEANFQGNIIASRFLRSISAQLILADDTKKMSTCPGTPHRNHCSATDPCPLEQA